MDTNDAGIDAAKQVDFRQRIADARAELQHVTSEPSSPDSAVWAAQAKVDGLEREYDAYLQAFGGS